MRKSAYLTYCLFCAVHFALAKKSLLRVSYVYTIIVSVLTGTRKGVLMSEATPLAREQDNQRHRPDILVLKKKAPLLAPFSFLVFVVLEVSFTA